jgi:hypothetical protein
VAVATGEGVGLAVTVGTEKLQVLEPVVDPVAVDVVQRERKRLSVPLIETAPLAPILFEALFYKAHLHVLAAAVLTRNK